MLQITFGERLNDLLHALDVSSFAEGVIEVAQSGYLHTASNSQVLSDLYEIGWGQFSSKPQCVLRIVSALHLANVIQTVISALVLSREFLGCNS